MKEHHLNLPQTPSVNNNIIQVRLLQTTSQKKTSSLPIKYKALKLAYRTISGSKLPYLPLLWQIFIPSNLWYQHKEAQNHFLKHLLLLLEWFSQFRLYFKNPVRRAEKLQLSLEGGGFCQLPVTEEDICCGSTRQREGGGRLLFGPAGGAWWPG